MTDKVEIKPDSTNETLEQSAEKLQKQGIDVSKDIITNSDASTEPTTEVKEEEVPKETRPSFLPEKFKNVEELVPEGLRLRTFAQIFALKRGNDSFRGRDLGGKVGRKPNLA